MGSPVNRTCQSNGKPLTVFVKRGGSPLERSLRVWRAANWLSGVPGMQRCSARAVSKLIGNVNVE